MLRHLLQIQQSTRTYNVTTITHTSFQRRCQLNKNYVIIKSKYLHFGPSFFGTGRFETDSLSHLKSAFIGKQKERSFHNFCMSQDRKQDATPYQKNAPLREGRDQKDRRPGISIWLCACIVHCAVSDKGGGFFGLVSICEH